MASEIPMIPGMYAVLGYGLRSLEAQKNSEGRRKNGFVKGTWFLLRCRYEGELEGFQSR